MSATAARSRGRVTPHALVLTVVVVGLLFALTFPVRIYLSQRSQVARLQQQQQVLQQQNGDLQRQITRLKSPGYLQQVARECLGMVRPGEIQFILAPKGQSNGGAWSQAPPTFQSGSSC